MEEYLNKPYWVIDILPKQVPADGRVQSVSGDDTYITVYNPAEEVLELIGSLAGSEGLFIWR